jgi:hypothetical protein
MKSIPPIVDAEAVIHGVLEVVWQDGYEVVVDLGPTIARGKIFAYLKSPENFRKLKLDDDGQSTGCVNDKDEAIAFSAGNLRSKAENQANLHKLVAELRV